MTKVQHGTFGTVNTPNNAQNQPQHYVVDNVEANNTQQQTQQFVQVTPNQMPSLESLQAQKRVVEKQESKKASSKMLEDLLFLGRIEKEVVIGGVTFTLTTPTARENQEIMQEYTSLEESVARMYILRAFTLAQALKKVNGVKLEDIEIEEQFTTLLKKKIFIVEQFQAAVLDKLMETLDEVVTEGNNAVNGDAIKK